MRIHTKKLILNNELALFLVFYYLLFNITLPGTPTTVALSLTSFNITELAPIFTLFPIVIFPKILLPHPTITLFFNVGCLFLLSFPVPPKVTPW